MKWFTFLLFFLVHLLKFSLLTKVTKFSPFPRTASNSSQGNGQKVTALGGCMFMEVQPVNPLAVDCDCWFKHNFEWLRAKNIVLTRLRWTFLHITILSLFYPKMTMTTFCQKKKKKKKDPDMQCNVVYWADCGGCSPTTRIHSPQHHTRPAYVFFNKISQLVFK